MTKRRIRRGLFLLAFMIAAVVVFSSESREDIRQTGTEAGVDLPVIMYHSILDSDAKAGKYIVTPAQLEKDVQYLLSQGYTPINVADLINYVNGSSDLPTKPVMLTFDDGFYNNYSYAFPIAKKYNVKIVIAAIGTCSDLFSQSEEELHNTYSHLTWDNMREMLQSGFVEIQSHTYDMHGEGSRKGFEMQRGETEEQYRQAVSEDLRKMSDRMQAELDVSPTALMYPFGYYRDDSDDFLKSLGYSATFTCYEHHNIRTRDSDSLFGLGRYNRASGKTSEQFFAGILT